MANHEDSPPFDRGGNGDWATYRRYVMEALKDIKDDARETKKTVDELERDMASLKVRIAIISAAIGGAIAFGGNLILEVLKK